MSKGDIAIIEKRIKSIAHLSAIFSCKCVGIVSRIIGQIPGVHIAAIELQTGGEAPVDGHCEGIVVADRSVYIFFDIGP